MELAVASSQLTRAHDQATQIFGRYVLHTHAEGCPCCVSEQDNADLRQGNLRRYAFKAMTTWGDETDFKHFLPVILAELTPASHFYPSTVHEGACDLDCLADKLSYARWQQWPEPEQRAVVNCLRAWWQVCLCLLRQKFSDFLAGRSADGWGNSVEPAYKELTQSKLLPAAWLQSTWRESWLSAPDALSAPDVQSPRFLLFVDWLYYLYYYDGGRPPEAGLAPNARIYLEEGFFYYASRSPDLAQRLSDLLYWLEHSAVPGPNPL